MSSNSDSSPRYIALDIHKHYALIAAVDREGQAIIKPRKVSNKELPDWAIAMSCSVWLLIPSIHTVWLRSQKFRLCSLN